MKRILIITMLTLNSACIMMDCSVYGMQAPLLPSELINEVCSRTGLQVTKVNSTLDAFMEVTPAVKGEKLTGSNSLNALYRLFCNDLHIGKIEMGTKIDTGESICVVTGKSKKAIIDILTSFARNGFYGINFTSKANSAICSARLLAELCEEGTCGGVDVEEEAKPIGWTEDLVEVFLTLFRQYFTD